MTATLQLGNQPFTQTDLLPLLTRYRLLPQLQREMAIDRAIETVACTAEEIATAREQFYLQNHLTSAEARQNWLSHQGLTEEELEQLAIRDRKIEKFKQMTFERKVESHFLRRKSQLDRVVYSVLRVRSPETAMELFFRISEGEQTFAEAARQYSELPEALCGGLSSLCELGMLPPALAQVLYKSHPGQLHQPLQFGEWSVLVRLEQSFPAQLDEPMRQRMINELFELWVQGQITLTNLVQPFQG